MTLLTDAIDILPALQTRKISGSVKAVRGLAIHAEHLPLSVGSSIVLEAGGPGDGTRHGEVIGFDGHDHVIMLYDDTDGIQPGSRICGMQMSGRLASLGSALLGRVVDGLGRPLDGLGPIQTDTVRPLIGAGIDPLNRSPVNVPFQTGIRVIDAMTTLGRGQRMGIFSRPGVGKSTLLASVARHSTSDVNVIALIGERGREVQEFIHDSLGTEGLAKSVVVVATSDESPLLRVRASLLATAIAEYFRDYEGGRHVLLAMDSLTRFAQAQRQIGLASGESPALRGYPPSVFSMLPILVERAGSVSDRASITGLYTVLVEGDDIAEPVSDAAQSVLDGHLVLCPKLAARGQYPAIDSLQSISRVCDRLSDENHRAGRTELKKLLAALDDAEDLLSIGAYVKGSDPLTDTAIQMQEQILGFLRQPYTEACQYPETCGSLVKLATDAIRMRQRLASGRTSGIRPDGMQTQ